MGSGACCHWKPPPSPPPPPSHPSIPALRLQSCVSAAAAPGPAPLGRGKRRESVLSRVPAGGAEPGLDRATLPERGSPSVTPWTCRTRARARCRVGWKERTLLRRKEGTRLRMGLLGVCVLSPVPVVLAEFGAGWHRPEGVLNWICPDFGAWSLLSEAERHQGEG